MSISLKHVTETCPRCRGEVGDPHNRNKPCIRCHGKKIVSCTTIELSPVTLIQLEPLKNESIEIKEISEEDLKKDEESLEFHCLVDPKNN